MHQCYQVRNIPMTVFLPKSDRTKVTVCRDLFLATTAIKKHEFSVWIKTLPHVNKGQAEGS